MLYEIIKSLLYFLFISFFLYQFFTKQNLSPGLVKTPMTDKIKSYTKIEPIDVAEACVVALSTAPNVLVCLISDDTYYYYY